MSIRIRGLDGNTTDLSRSAVDDFASTLSGSLVERDGPDYESARTIWNGMIDKQPCLIARCTGIGDVRRVVDFARDNQLLLAVRGGGHNIAGSGLCDGGLVLDLSPMRGVRVDPDRRRVWVEPGNRWSDVDRDTQEFGLAVPNGIVSTTGVAGLTLGGGFGWLTRKYGLTSDNLRSAQVVTASGDIVTADSERNPELFWGLRGAGANFGVVTSFEFEAHPHGPEVMCGLVAHPRKDAREVMEFFRDFTAQAPEEVSTLLVLRKAPPAPFLDESVHGAPIAAIAACYAGPAEEGRKALAPIKEFGDPLGDVIAPKPFAAHQSMLDKGNPTGRRYYWKSEYFDEMQDGLIDTMLDNTEELPSAHAVTLFFHLGGAAARRDADFSAAGHRDAEYVLNISAGWDDPAHDERCRGWARAYHEAVQPYSNGGVYVNFLTDEEGDARVRAAYGPEKYDRLTTLKRRWDPGNLFRVNKNIPPA
jgi:FAD/FMN-containing dehydrogenase